ncbi:MAG TPA: VIT1/CCC1 transporter family protein [Acidimicrobiales bacterium]|nr:VIT1/CCC1 transporter family protein [Acidimicrobiales bacterium]
MQTGVRPSNKIDAARLWLSGRDPNGTSRHRDVKSGGARAAVLGAGDGLITNVSLVLGVAGATANASTVRLAGVAGLLAGAFSMAAGELVSVRAQRELAEKELDVERRELADQPEDELRELAAMYRARGVPDQDAMTVARILSANEKVALDTHARLELGIDPDESGSPVKAAVFSFVAFTLGAILPLFPWFFTSGATGVVLSIAIGGVSALLLGALIGAMAGRSVVGTALRQLVVAALAAAVTFGVGHLLGVQAT